MLRGQALQLNWVQSIGFSLTWSLFRKGLELKLRRVSCLFAVRLSYDQCMRYVQQLTKLTSSRTLLTCEFSPTWLLLWSWVADREFFPGVGHTPGKWPVARRYPPRQPRGPASFLGLSLGENVLTQEIAWLPRELYVGLPLIYGYLKWGLHFSL